MAVPYQPTWAGAYAANPFAGNPNVAQPMQLQQPVNGVIKVNGRDSALQYALPPNSMSPALFDSGGKMFYIVSTDGAGAKTVETFDYSPHEEETVAVASYVGREEFDALAKKVQEMMEAASEVDLMELMAVLDEHMEAVKVVHPKEYEAVIRRIRGLK